MSDHRDESRILTLVFTDLADSTALKTARGDQIVGTLIDRHRAHVRALSQAAGGRIVDWAGDGCFLTFDTPSAAVVFALRLQAAERDDADLPPVRIGVHMGEVSERAGPDGPAGPPRVEGLAVDVASRICGLARPGQILTSAAVADSARPRVPADAAGGPIAWRAHGAYDLKGFHKPLEILSVGLEADGVFEAPASSAKAAPARPARSTSTLVWVLAVVAVGAGAVVYRSLVRPPEVGRGPDAITSLAVLPFENMSGDPDREYFADGMTESLISELAKATSLKVISRTSAMHYKGTDEPLRRIASELGVDAIVEGSVFEDGTSVRITAQLIRGATDEHLWAESYTESLENVLQLQGRIALAITHAIQARVSPSDVKRLSSARPVDPEAHLAFLRGRESWFRFTPQSLKETERYYREAIRHDPTYAPPYAYLAFMYWVPSIEGWAAPDFPVARALANEALRLDPMSAQAQLSKAWIAYVDEWNWREAEAGFGRAISHDPSQPEGYFGLADMLVNLGRTREALDAIKTAVERDPLSPLNQWELGWVQMYSRDYVTAGRTFDAFLASAPDFTPALAPAALVYLELGRRDDALRVSERSVALDPAPLADVRHAALLARLGRRGEAERTLRTAIAEGKQRYLPPAAVGYAWAALGDADEALRWLDRGLDDRDYWVFTLATDPVFDPFRNDPRFAERLRRMHMPTDDVGRAR